MVIMKHNLIALKLNIFQKILKNLIVKENISTSIYKKQANDSIMCGYFCIEFIDFMVRCESFLDHTNLFPPKQYEKNEKIILECFQ